MQRRKGDAGAGAGGSSSSISPTDAESAEVSHLKDKPRGSRRRRIPASSSSSRVAAAVALLSLCLLAAFVLLRPPQGSNGAAAAPGMPNLRGPSVALENFGARHSGGDGNGPPQWREQKLRRDVPDRSDGAGASPSEDVSKEGSDVAAGGGAGTSPPRRPVQRRRRTSAEATAEMLSQPSDFVDGEKKLKAAMVELLRSQKGGKDLGARVLTRWLGDDISPVAPTDEAERKEWEGRVKRRQGELAEREREFWEERAKEVAAAAEEVRDGGDDTAGGEGSFHDEDKGKKHAGIKAEGGAATRDESSVGQGGRSEESLSANLADRVELVEQDGKIRRVAEGSGEVGGISGSVHNEKEEVAHARVKGGRSRPVEAGGGGRGSDSAGGGGAGGGAASKLKDYPSPAEMASDNAATVVLEPTFGAHRPQSNAIFAFAEGYDLKIYLTFLESLRSTGYSGDVVLAVSSPSKLKEGVEEYLRSFSHEPSGAGEDSEGLNVVVYAVDWTCYDGKGNVAADTREGAHKCKINGLYGVHDPNVPEEAPRPNDDPRDARPVATARYELYWAWSERYLSRRWIMLIDSRDAYFQSDPFRRLGDVDGVAGELHLFEENAESTTLGQSTFNRNWLTTAYGYGAVKSYFDKPIVCSGSTVGQQVAIESYLRAMVAQFDATGCMVKGCDQGFHNYLHYSDGLRGVAGIGEIVVHPQGKGIINNLGLLRDKPLRERGVLVKNKSGEDEVVNWDGEASPVVHQFDRDKDLDIIVKQRRKKYRSDWKSRAEQLKSAA